LHTLEESGEAVRRRQMGSELDLNTFARFTVEDPVSQIVVDCILNIAIDVQQ